jgi:hypothetical protein
MTSFLQASSLLADTSVPLVAVRVVKGPELDGRLDDEVWLSAQRSSAFTQKFPNELSAPSEETTVRVVYDDTAVYVAVDCVQRTTPVIARLSRRDRHVESDWVSVALGTNGDGKTAYEFRVNAAGTPMDTLRFRDTESSLEWDENWEAQTFVTKSGWSVEYRIPFRILRYSVVPVHAWRFQVRRYVAQRQETDEWAYSPRNSAGEVSRYGFLEDLRDLPRPAQLEVRPFALAKLTRRDAGADADAAGVATVTTFGGDVKWHVTPRLTLDATVNPDFAQVEMDQLTLNLTSYEVYYSEKRPFFLEGIDTFTLPYQLVYTRRIGRTPLPPILHADERLATAPGASPLLGALKLVGRLDDRWSFGALTALTGANRVDVVAADGVNSRRLVEPMTLYNIFRLTRDVGENASIGGLVTLTDRLEQTSDQRLSNAPVLTPAGAISSPTERETSRTCPTGIVVPYGSRCFADALVAGLDYRWRSPGGDYAADGQLYMSRLHNGPPRMVSDGTSIHAGDIGTGVLVYFAKDGGDHFLAELALARSSRKLDVNDVGFALRANRQFFDASVEYRELSPWGPFLETHVRLEAYMSRSIDGLTLADDFQLNARGTLQNFWNVSTAFHFLPTYFDDREVGDGTTLQRAGRLQHDLELSTNPAKPVFVTVTTQTEILEHAFAVTGTADVVLRPHPQFELQLGPTLTHTTGEWRYAEDHPESAAHLFGRLAANGIGATLRTSYTFTPTLDLISYAQLFLATGRYDDLSVSSRAADNVVSIGDLRPSDAPLGTGAWQEAALNANVLLRWEYSLGSTLFLVYTRTQSPTVSVPLGATPTLDFSAIGRAPTVELFMAKLSYWFG